MFKTRSDISHENFDIFFANHLPSITPQAKETLPRDISFALYHGADPKVSNTVKLNFITKLWVLWKCFRKNIWIIVQDDNGISPEKFAELSKAISKKRTANKDIEDNCAPIHFVTGNKELCDTMDYLNKICVSPYYNYLTKGKNKIPNKVAEWKEQMKYIVQHLDIYERTKKKWTTETGICMAEFYVLMVCYSGNPTKGSDIYHNFYKSAYSSSRTKIKLAFRTLQDRGYIIKHGYKNGSTLQITPLGTEYVNTIISKYVLNC